MERMLRKCRRSTEATDPSVKATVGASRKEDTPFEARRTAVRVGL
jgi:hypothetical protein